MLLNVIAEVEVRVGRVLAQVTPEQLHPGGVGRPAVNGEAHLGPEGEGAHLADEQPFLFLRLLLEQRVLLRVLRPRVSGEEAVLGGDKVATLALEMRLPEAVFTRAVPDHDLDLTKRSTEPLILILSAI